MVTNLLPLREALKRIVQRDDVKYVLGYKPGSYWLARDAGVCADAGRGGGIHLFSALRE